MITVPIAGFSGVSYFAFIMFLVVVTAATTSFYQIGVFAAASRFPHKYLQGIMSGQALAGTAVALSSILSALAASPSTKPDEEAIRRSAVLYFLSALLITVVALVGYLVLLRQQFFLYYMTDRPGNNALLHDEDDNDDDLDPEFVFQSEETVEVTILSVLKKIKLLAFSVAYVFVVTIAVFPSITALVKSVRAHPPSSGAVNVQLPRVLQDDIFVAFHFLIFNICDWVGRIFPLSSWLRTSNPSLLTIYSLLRTACIPLFLFCNVIATDKTAPVLINSDFVYFVLLVFFSLTNGWIASLCMMAIPDLSSLGTPEEKSLGGSIMSFCLCAGLAIGGVSSFVVRSMV
ncbi:equilibrative nucleoside transporter [Umbelopsis sp. PMI_123]|nr:equilibrative nucleoside transporter [Umbelopsis sp. PMI_123]